MWWMVSSTYILSSSITWFLALNKSMTWMKPKTIGFRCRELRDFDLSLVTNDTLLWKCTVHSGTLQQTFLFKTMQWRWLMYVLELMTFLSIQLQPRKKENSAELKSLPKKENKAYCEKFILLLFVILDIMELNKNLFIIFCAALRCWVNHDTLKILKWIHFNSTDPWTPVVNPTHFASPTSSYNDKNHPNPQYSSRPDTPDH